MKMDRSSLLRIALSLAGLSVSSSVAYAQSLFTLDGKGSAILTSVDSPIVRVSVSDKTFTVSSTYASDNGVRSAHYGFAVAGKAKSSIASLLNKDGFAQDVEYSAFYGQRLRIKDPDSDQSHDKFFWTVRASYQTSRYKTIDTGETNFTTRVLHSPGATLYLRAEPKGGNSLAGVSVGYKKANNIDDLKADTLQKQTILTSEGGVVTALVSSTDVYRGTYRSFNSVPLVADYLMFQAKTRMATDLFVRTDLKGNGSKVTPGLAFLFYEKGKPTQFSSGVALTYNSKEKYQVRLVAGLNY